MRGGWRSWLRPVAESPEAAAAVPGELPPGRLNRFGHDAFGELRCRAALHDAGFLRAYPDPHGGGGNGGR